MSVKKNKVSVMEAISKQANKAHWVPTKEIHLTALEDATRAIDEINKLPDLTYTRVKAGKHSKYIANVECGFDLENTTVDNITGKKTIVEDGNQVEVDCHEYHGYMYIWQFCFGELLITGRTWAQWISVMSAIQFRYPELGKHTVGKKNTVEKTVLIADANAGYEFQYYSKLKYQGNPIVRSVFAGQQRRPITVSLSFNWFDNAFKVIDVLLIGSLSLASLAKDYCTTQKLKGDLDYSKPRNSMTPLTPKEMDYCRNDVIILHEYMTYYLETFVKTCKLTPVTKTGLVRESVKHMFKTRKEDVRHLASLFPENYEKYSNIMQLLYRGGYTHANAYNVGVVHENVHGMDFTSSYPAVMNSLDCLYPIEKFEPKKVTVDELDTYADDHECCWYATFTFHKLQSTTHHSVESVAKVVESFGDGRQTTASKLKAVRECGITVDNGRVAQADEITVLLTEQDWRVYRQFYTWDGEPTVNDFYCATRGLLPEYLTSVVRYFYKKKAELKRMGLSGTTAYVVAKQLTNSCYGLTVESVHINEESFDTDKGWTTVLNDPEDTYARATLQGDYLFDRYGALNTPKLWMPPQYGIWITAHARRRILTAIYELKDDCIYSDTDSVYFKNYEQHKQWFDEWNATIDAQNQQLFGTDYEFLGDLGTFDPVAIEWKDDSCKHESLEYSFKTWGAKRYIKMDADGHMEQTIAGLPKGTVLRSVMKAHPEWDERTAAFNCFDIFQGGLELDLDDSNKLTTAYNDEAHSDVVTDEFGNTETMTEASSVCLYKIPFKMTVDKYFIAYVEAIRKDAYCNG